MTAGSAQRAPEISDLFSFDTRRHGRLFHCWTGSVYMMMIIQSIGRHGPSKESDHDGGQRPTGPGNFRPVFLRHAAAWPSLPLLDRISIYDDDHSINRPPRAIK